jgi:hypothetical protein
MATSKGKAKAQEEIYPDLPAPSSEAGGSDQGLLDIQSHLMALQQAQVKQAIAAKTDREETQKQFSTLNTSLQGLLAMIQAGQAAAVQGAGTANAPLPSRETSLPTANQPNPATERMASIDPVLERGSAGLGRDSPGLSFSSNSNYKPKAKDPARFENNQGTIKYTAWKEQILDKFEIDREQFPTERAFMSYIFNRTEGEANDHLFPRYTRDPDNTDPFTSYEEMLATLDTIYKNPFLVRDSRNQYKELKMGVGQSFHDFRTRFIHLANTGRIPLADWFDDMYDKMTTALQGQILNQRHLLEEDFDKLCTVAIGIDAELKRLNARRTKERDARLSQTNKPTPTPALRPPFVVKPTSAGFSLLQRPANPAAVPTPVPAAPVNIGITKCYNCQELGHLSRDCPKPRRAPTIKDIEEEVAECEVESEEDVDTDQGKDDA